MITNKLNKWKSLYVDLQEINFQYPIYREDDLKATFSIYVYNDSPLPKVFMLKSLGHEKSGCYFYLTQQENASFVKPIALLINPFSASNLNFQAKFSPTSDSDRPDLNESDGILTYRTGKMIKTLTIPLGYHSPI